MSKLIFPTGHSYLRHSYEDPENYEIPEAWMDNFKWTGREDYLEWVAEWKTILKSKIAAIREEKIARRNRFLSDEDRNAAQHERQLLRIDCHNLLILRIFGKVQSRRQRDERKMAVNAAIT
jgi:hypothetical protein